MKRSLALAAAALLLTAGCGDEEPTAEDPATSPSSSSAAPTEEPTDPGPSETAEPPADLVTVPIYFAGDTPTGTRLFREFRQVEADNPADEALALLAAGDALDPDYGTLLPPGSARLTSYDESIIVEPDPSWVDRPGDMTDEQARLAVQQIVYTVQGIVQKRSPVTFVLDGQPTTVFGLGPTEFKAAKQLDVLALMNVTTPEEGANVSGTFTAEGVGSSFEATVPWEVRDESGTAVVEGFTTAEGFIDKLYPWTAEVDVSGLAPGTYTFVAMTDDPSDGEGAGPTEDTKTIVVS